MPSRVGILSASPVSADGRHLLILPGDATELVDPSLTPEDLAERHGLDEVVRGPKISVCTAIYLDGPLAGTTTSYAINQLGSRVGYALPPRPSGPRGTYEVVRLAEGEHPAELRHIEPTDDEAQRSV
ncbi:hypothetical protein ACFYUY_23865 [Kitasatospora sp. NPDC004745]|uniref:hypothetical protein n=1 Tax=Kitasatospora sp. NPDC004745 TaxID=3364019 RepID=UPI0036AC9634